jgi:hypothetical protein
VSAYYYYGDYGTWQIDEVSVAEPGTVAGMSISPPEMYFNVHPAGSDASSLTITNTGTSVLNYLITEGLPASAPPAIPSGGDALSTKRNTPIDQSPQADLSWLSVSPSAGSITAGQFETVSVSCDGAVGSGDYVGYLVISGNDPGKDIVVIPVSLTVSGVVLLGPSPADEIAMGSTYDIEWSLSEAVNSIDISLSTDGGQTFGQSIVTGYSGSSPYTWPVPDQEYENCVVQITCTTQSAGTISDISDGTFAIVNPDPTGYEGGGDAPIASRLFQNHPNPFNPTTTIRYDIADRARVSLRIYNVGGALVRILVDETQEADSYAVVWDGRNSKGNLVPSGVYFYKLDFGRGSQTKKMVLLK